MLDICRTFFNQLNSNKIRYCHWKSNAHLTAALAGKTDLDLLIQEDDKEKFRNILMSFQFLRMASPALKTFPFLEDYLIFDNKSGELIHLHIHYRLILGQKFIKNHHLPLEQLFLQNRIQRNGIYIPKPELELIVLIVRVCMKTGIRDILEQFVHDILGQGKSAIPTAIRQELEQLIKKANMEEWKELLSKSKLPITPNFIHNFIKLFSDRKIKFHDLFRMHFTMLYILRKFRRTGATRATFKYFYLWMVNQKHIRCCFPSLEKRLTGVGFSVAVVGADGSGKSTLTDDLHKWLSWKLLTNLYYYGIPKTKVISSVHLLLRMANKSRQPWLEHLIETGLWIFIARSRYLTSKSIIVNTKKCIISIIDRFPMPEFQTMQNPMDGPRIKKSQSWSGDLFANTEAAFYQKITRPDLIIVLQASVETLRQRKIDLDYETHTAKASAVNSITLTQDTILIDANSPYTEVLLKAKTSIWQSLATREKCHA